ncbi:MAG: phage tail tape measure protein, partial [Peptostreptococcaceae bacterium]
MADETKRVRAVFETDVSKFNSGLQGINKQLKESQAELKLASTNLKNFGKSNEELGKVQQALSRQIEVTNQKLKVYEKAFDEATKKVDQGVAKRKELDKALQENEKALKSIQQQYGKESQEARNLEGDLEKLKDQYNKNEKSIENAIKKSADYKTQMDNTKTSISNLEGDLKKVNVAIEQQGNKWLAASQKMEKIGQNMTNVGSTISGVSNKILGASTAMAGGIGYATKLFMDFETGIAKIGTIADTSAMSLENIKSGIINLSNETGISTNELNEALYETLSAGVSTGDSINFLSNTVKLAKGGFATTTEAVDVMTTVLNAYGLSATEATRVSDILVQTQNKGKTTVQELSGALGK